MSKQPFLPLFFGDFLASTAEWTGEEQALYLLLLGHQWSLGSLPTDVSKLARLARWDRKGFDRCWSQVSEKFVERDGRLINERLEQHRTRASEIAGKRAAAGRRGAEATNSKTSASDAANAEASDAANAASLPRHPIQSNPREKIPVETSAPDSCVSANLARAKVHTRARSPDLETDARQRFLRLQAAYPKFAGRQDWLTAEHHCRNLVENHGESWDALTAGVERYAGFVAAGGVSSPAFVITPAKFFGSADKPWTQPWDLPPTKAETRLAGNLDAAAEFMRRTEHATG